MAAESKFGKQSEIRSFRDLIVWQKGMDLTEEAYTVAKLLPQNERFGLKMQIQRAAVSVPANIAEGHARKLTGEYLHHLAFAAGSTAELLTHLEIAVRLKYVTQEQVSRAVRLCEEESRMLHALILKLKQRRDDRG